MRTTPAAAEAGSAVHGAAGDPGQTVQLAAAAAPGANYQTVTLMPSDGNSDEVSYVLIVQVSEAGLYFVFFVFFNRQHSAGAET